VPAFLGTEDVPAAAEPASDLEEFMAAVLLPTETVVPPEPMVANPEREEAQQIAEAPILGAGSSPRVDLPLLPVPSIEDLPSQPEEAVPCYEAPPPQPVEKPVGAGLPDWLLEPGEGAAIPEWMKRPDRQRRVAEPVWVGPERGTRPPEPAPEPEPTAEPEPVSEPEPQAAGGPEAQADVLGLDALPPAPPSAGFVTVPFIADIVETPASDEIPSQQSMAKDAMEAPGEMQEPSAEELGGLEELQALVESLDASLEIAPEVDTVEESQPPVEPELPEEPQPPVEPERPEEPELPEEPQPPVEPELPEEPEPPVEPELIPEAEITPEVEATADAEALADEDSAVPAEQTGAPDFSELLESLDVDEVASTEVGLDVEVEIDESVVAVERVEQQAEAVIETTIEVSTDMEIIAGHATALEDEAAVDAPGREPAITDLGFGVGLTDELSALTGVGRRQTTRPRVSVNRLPATGGVLKRDTRVDKETLLKIIDGISNL
jgi:S-DNA-T family DNA segregation ATPase FtsK/SpoIIIE